MMRIARTLIEVAPKIISEAFGTVKIRNVSTFPVFLPGNVDRFDIFKIGETVSLAAVQKLAYGLVVSDPGVLVPDRDREKFKETFGRFGSDGGNDRW
jgi:hypothetical protein